MIQRTTFFRLLLCYGLVQLIYFPLYEGGFVTDFTGLLDRYEGSTALDILNSFGYPALQPVLNFFLYIFYQLFGTWGLPWYLIYSFVFALNATLLFAIVQKLCRQFNVQHATWISTATAVLFIISPYNVEVLYWRVLFNFLSVTTYIFIALLFSFRYAERPSTSHLLWIHLPFLLGIFTFELALMLPLLIVVYTLFFYLERRDKAMLRRMALYVVLPQLLGIVAWVLLTKLIVGQYIGHYGAATHLNFDPILLISTFLKYTAKHLLLLRYLPDADGWYTYLQSSFAILVFVVLLVGGSVFCYLNWQRLQPEWKLAVLNFYWFGIALLPILNLYFYTLKYLENDRYGYLGWAFLAATIVFILSRLFCKRWLFLLVILLYAAWHLYHSKQMVHWANQATNVHKGLLEDFDYADHSEVYLLGFADNLEGIYIFRDYTKSDKAFGDALKYIEKTPIKGQLLEIAQFNMTAPDNQLKATVDTLGRIQITFGHWGSWWWRAGKGMISYETDKLKVEQKDLMLYITPKSPAQDAIFLYQVGNKWRQLDYFSNSDFKPIRPGPD